MIGKVTYKGEAKIGQDIVNIVNGKHGPNFFRSVQGRAESLLWKRDYFRHEEEIRVICLQRDGKLRSENLRHFAFDPNEVFEEISFDPRLISFEKLEREAEIKRLGYNGKVVRDDSYAKNFYLLEMHKDWPDPEPVGS